jgi:hypothetical protein
MVEPKQIQDDEIVAWINEGLLVIRRLHEPNPIIYFCGRKLKAELHKQAGYIRRVNHNGTGSERHRIQLRYKRRRRSIVRSKLVNMFVEKSVVPPGHIVHHKDLNRFNDAADNLERITELEHEDIHYGKF